PSCGAPAKFDIIRQEYVCGYCGGQVGIKDALQEKQGFRQIHKDKMNDSLKSYRLMQANCSGCGATLVFEENEALSSCAFCGRALVRSEYLSAKNMPECIIPFRITESEAKDLLTKWCDENRGKAESEKLKSLIPELKGFYLPYELVRGPVSMTVSRMDRGSEYDCEGFINDEFVNRSKQLDNLLLDGMEPFDLDDITEFDFAYVAGQRVKIADITDKDLELRVREETAQTYKPSLSKTMESKALDVFADVGSAFRLPTLLPVYYISKGDVMAAVNGQTGKVSVRAVKDSHYYFLPWWFKAILATLAFSLALFLSLCAFGAGTGASLYITGLTAIVFIIVTLCYYSDTAHNAFSVVSGRKIFTSGEKTFTRDHGNLVLSDEILKRKVVEPVFFKKLKDEWYPVVLKFTTPGRVLKIAMYCLIALFLPVILALLINGFDFQRLELGGSAVWFCIAVPTVPIYLLKFGIEELYDRPLVYTIGEDGKKKRYLELPKIRITKGAIRELLRIMFIPPASLAFWFGVICFFTMVYLTAFGFD
ncbi:MAG: hypothetical protein Q4D71_08750, partial [Oscillospiraceae bacterium]|nr:hypothetical protein [Oscillospiraceae bacterium]